MRAASKVGLWNISFLVCARAQSAWFGSLGVWEPEELGKVVKIADIPPNDCAKTVCQKLHIVCHVVLYGALASHDLLKLPVRNILE